MPKLMITVDVEAQPARARDHHVDRLIWGAYPEGRAGIGEMMDLANEFDAVLTMFVDWAETDLYGAAIEEVGREIARRKHDVQLHVHADFFSKKFWSGHNIKPRIDLNLLSLPQAEAIAGEIVQRHTRATGLAPTAFRGGGYRFCDSLLHALHQRGVRLDSSLNSMRRAEASAMNCKQFVSPSGLLELPISIVSNYKNGPRPLEFNFNTGYFRDVASMYAYLDAFWDEHGSDTIAVLVMHSWSFLARGADEHFAYEGLERLNRFRGFLEGLKPAGIEVVSAQQVVDLVTSGRLLVEPPKEVGTSSPVKREPVAPSPACPVCGAPKSSITKLNGRQCSQCGSLERQRSVAVAYDSALRGQYSIEGKEVLVLSPSAAEIKFLQSRGAKTISADIMPDRKADLVVNFCSMPEVRTASRPVVFASYVMPLIYDLGKALDEIARILEEGGTFFSVEAPVKGETREIEDATEQAKWYGAEAWERYRVGTFRILGSISYLANLKARFEVQVEVVPDPITGTEATIYVCRKPVRPPEGPPVRPLESFETAPRDISSHFLEFTESNLRDGWVRDGFRLPSVLPPIDWNAHNRSFAYHLHAWDAISDLLIRHSVKGEPEYLEACLAHAKSWILAFQVPVLGKDSDEELDRLVKPNMPVEWYDMAVGLRAFRMAYLLDVLIQQGREQDAELFRQSLLFHLKLLRRDHFFREHSNHGLYQAFGQAAAARRFLDWPGFAEDYAMGMQRLRRLLRFHFSEEGPHLEHSPGYHFMLMGTLVNARRSGFFDDDENMKLMTEIETAFQWMVKPNFCLAEFGDTDPRNIVRGEKIAALYREESTKFILTGGSQGKKPPVGVKAYPKSGYVFARLGAVDAGERFEDLSYLAQQAGFHSRVHKHADHLSFIWYDRGRDILIDPARFAYANKTQPGTELFKQGFWYADPKRIYIETTRAHNCVEIDGTSFDRRTTCWGSALRYAGEQSGMAITDCNITHLRTVLHRRTLIMKPGQFLLVLDWLNDRTTDRHYRQWFQFASRWVVDLVGGEALAKDGAQDLTVLNLIPDNEIYNVVRGQTEPHLQGWTSDGPYSLTESTSLAVRCAMGKMGRFATLFVLGKAVSLPQTRFNATLRSGRVVWSDAGGQYSLQVKMGDPGDVAVTYEGGAAGSRASRSMTAV
ncbi:heparinase II/III domain-containing protein [Reyranella sp.]|uniref:heparinase II/III domain-containing protein n=1 Tax=Reyranella sp. TaxID=1929291 RepID=UPI004035AE1F